MQGLERSALSDRQEPDAHMTLSEVAWPVFREVSVLAPFGAGNPKPLFRISGVTVASMRRFGKEKNHVEVQLVCRETGASLRAFDFSGHPKIFSATPRQASRSPSSGPLSAIRTAAAHIPSCGYRQRVIMYSSSMQKVIIYTLYHNTSCWLRGRPTAAMDYAAGNNLHRWRSAE